MPIQGDLQTLIKRSTHCAASIACTTATHRPKLAGIRRHQARNNVPEATTILDTEVTRNQAQ